MKSLRGVLPGRPIALPLWIRKLRLDVFHRSTKRSDCEQRRVRVKPGTSQYRLLDNTSLETSFSIWVGIRDIQRHKLSHKDLQYALLAGLIVASLWISPPAPVTKSFSLMAGVWMFLTPATRQFFLPSITIWVWLIYYFCSRFITYNYRPHIWVRVLPALENVLYGANLSKILSTRKHIILDILAWLPYGIIHFGAPAICSLLIFVFAAPGTTPIFVRSFGWMSILGVTIQLVFPCTPPWYEIDHGLVSATYDMPGSPAGLARIDAIFGMDLYTTNFTTGPLPFGAFPSLHAGYAVLEAFFMSHCFPRFRTFFIIYVGWMWWATMYLSHHYAVDLVGGSLIAMAFFYTARSRWLPKLQEGKHTRWDYDDVEIGDHHQTVGEEASDRVFQSRFD